MACPDDKHHKYHTWSILALDMALDKSTSFLSLAIRSPKSFSMNQKISLNCLEYRPLPTKKQATS